MELFGTKDFFRFVSFRFVSIRFDSIRFDSIRFDSIRFDSIRFDSIRFDSIRFDSIQFNSFVLKSTHRDDRVSHNGVSQGTSKKMSTVLNYMITNPLSSFKIDTVSCSVHIILY